MSVFQMTFLLKNKNYLTGSIVAAIPHCLYVWLGPSIYSIYLPLGYFHHPYYDMRQLQVNASGEGKEMKHVNLSATMTIIKMLTKSTDIHFNSNQGVSLKHLHIMIKCCQVMLLKAGIMHLFLPLQVPPKV